MIYTIPYVLLVLFYGVLAWFYHQSDKESQGKIRILCVFVYMLFFGFRGFVADDWAIYYPVYMSCSVDSLQNALYAFEDTGFEPGFTLLMLLSKFIFNDYRFFVFICCAINCSLLFLFLNKRVENVPLAIVFFICMGGIGMQINLMRNSISILLFINAIGYMMERKALPYFLICLLSFTFHISAILYFPLYFFFYKRFPKWIFLVVFFVGNIIFLAHIRYIIPIMTMIASRMGDEYVSLIEVYTDYYGDISWGISIGYIERLLTGLLIFCYYDKLLAIRKENAVYINSFLAYFFMYFFFSEVAVIGNRLSILFIYFYWIIWGDLLKCFSVRNNKMLFMSFLAVYCVLKVAGKTRLITMQYDNVLFGAKSYEERLYIFEKNMEDESNDR